MSDLEIQELTEKIDKVWAVVTRLEERVTDIIARTPNKIHTDHPYIVRMEGICGGRPLIEGTRLSVKHMVSWARMGMTVEEIVEQNPYASAAQVADALAYYEDHPEEIEAEFAEEQRYLNIEIPRIQRMIVERCS